MRKFVGIVFQNADDQIFSPTVEQDVAFGPTNLGLDEETIHHRVHEALKIVGIEDLAERVPHHLSGGEKKRVAIAGVIAMEPEVLVLDEPTAGLDPQGVQDLVGFINSLSKKYGMTVIFSTHDVGACCRGLGLYLRYEQGEVCCGRQRGADLHAAGYAQVHAPRCAGPSQTPPLAPEERYPGLDGIYLRGSREVPRCRPTRENHDRGTLLY